MDLMDMAGSGCGGNSPPTNMGEPTILIDSASFPADLLGNYFGSFLQFVEVCIEFARELQKAEGKISVLVKKATAEIKWAGKTIAYIAPAPNEGFLNKTILIGLDEESAPKLMLFPPKGGKIINGGTLVECHLVLARILKPRINDLKEIEKLSQEAKRLSKKGAMDYLANSSTKNHCQLQE